MSEFQVFRGPEDYRDRKTRERLAQKPATIYRSKYPFAKMKPGDFFIIPVDIKDKKAQASLRITLHQAAKAAHIFIKTYVNRNTRDEKFSMYCVHDGSR